VLVGAAFATAFAVVVAAAVGTVKPNGEDEVVLKVGVGADENPDALLATKVGVFRLIVLTPLFEASDAADRAVKKPAGVVNVAMPVDRKVPEAWEAKTEGAAAFVHPTVAVTVTVTVTAPVEGGPTTVGAEKAEVKMLDRVGDGVVEVSGNALVVGIGVNETGPVMD